MVQSMLSNPSEMKQVFLDGKFSHITDYSKKWGEGFGNDADLIQWATTALESLRSRLGEENWMSQLIRVDIMRDAKGFFRMNEIKGLQAMYEAKSADNLRVFNSLKEYWKTEQHIHIIQLCWVHIILLCQGHTIGANVKI